MKIKLNTTLTIAFVLFLSLSAGNAKAQTINEYSISFDNLKQNEAQVTAVFKNLNPEVLEVRMSRSSPGRYALHEFAKNVYSVEAFNSKGEKLTITRPNPHQWNVSGHDGTVFFKYTLFANHGDGTYAQVDETHAHLNIPAVFVTAKGLGHRPVEVTFQLPKDSKWKIATQLKHLHGTTYFAPDTYYFLDSPVEIADFHLRERIIDGQNIRLVLHTPATEKEVDDYFEKVIAIVKAQIQVFGQLPKLDFGEYTFLNCLMPNASGDGMEHRNSTMISSSKPLDKPLGETSIGTVSHEFIHTWSTERLRPRSLEPFNFDEANMSGELWYSEGFTSYYTSLIMARTGITPKENYITSLGRTVSYVENSSGRDYFNPIEMSYQAPFVDAARSVDATNRGNTFISYYTYGNVLGLALDLQLRSMDNGKNADRFMELMWIKYGETEIAYTVRDLQATLEEYTSKEFASNFFDNYIFDSKLPDFKALFKNFGILYKQTNLKSVDFGGFVTNQNGKWKLFSTPRKGSAIYNAGINTQDEFISIGGKKLTDENNFTELLKTFKPGQTVEIITLKFGTERKYKIKLDADSSYSASFDGKAGKKELERRNDWLK